jgi:SRSO17 transposase
MTTNQILSLGPELALFLGEFSGSFGRTEPRGKLAIYVRGQLGQLPRKSIEPMALAAGVKPRTLQEFLASDLWDEEQLGADVRRLVATEHADPQAIGVIDESGHPKKGDRTAGVSRQYCGNTGKIDNCVMTVHLTYTSFDGEFRTMLDSSLYLPQCWHEDRDRCRDAKIPDDLVYRPKYEIALEQLDRAAADGVRFAWITADEWYTQKPTFVRGLEGRGLRYVLEMPKNFALWLHDPRTGPATPAKPVENLCRYSRVLMRQTWQRYYIKDTDKGPMVWEVKYAPCWLPRAGGVVGPYWLIVARNALNPDEIKYFVSNAAPGVPLPAILHVAFGRWPVERCLQDEKSELGLSHFEVRCYPALKRHLLITQVSHLFLARQTQRLRGEKPGVDFAAGAYGDQRPPRRAALAEPGAGRAVEDRRGKNRILASAERQRPEEPHENTPRRTRKGQHQPRKASPPPSSLAKQSALWC